jgi:hypothetical protein
VKAVIRRRSGWYPGLIQVGNPAYLSYKKAMQIGAYLPIQQHGNFFAKLWW